MMFNEVVNLERYFFKNYDVLTECDIVKVIVATFLLKVVQN